ncbi:MAG: LytTR family DNA-binding domain-containing protein, partial [Bacteroidota bacterium]
LAHQFENAVQAISFVQENTVDLMFVDINMPDLNGMDFVKSLSDPPKIIFTTAYSEYALEGFRVDAVDYLLKPIGYSQFLKSAQKGKERVQQGKNKAGELQSDDDFLFIKSEYRILRVKLSDIKYIEGMREYLRIHMQSEEPIMTLMSMKKMEEYLPKSNFMRVHRSYIVGLDKVKTVERNRIVFDEGIYIPISEKYKSQFQEYLDDNFLI